MIWQADVISSIPEESCASNVRSALARNLSRVALTPAKPGRLAIVASGPSAKGHLDELREWDGEIWTINGAMGWLHDEGVKFHAWVALDADPVMTELVVCDPPGLTYYVASQCDPWLFDKLDGRNVNLWHARYSGMPFPRGEPIIPGGTTCLTRAPFLARCLGWRDVSLFGGDSSYTDEMYAYRYDRYALRPDPKVQRVTIGGKEFLTSIQLIHQASEISAMLEVFAAAGGGTLTLRSGGMVEAFIASPLRQVSEFMTDDERKKYGVAA